MRVIRNSFNPNRVVSDDSILLFIDADQPETYTWGEIKESIADASILIMAEESLRTYGLVNVPVIFDNDEKECKCTFRLLEKQ